MQKTIPLNTYFFLHAFLKITLCAWLQYEKFTGYIPSYTYPVTFNAGDQISAILSWPGTEDLDIYLYSDGMDLLDRNTRIDRQFSPTLNPEILDYSIATTGIYYLRVDLYSTDPTPYQFQIKVNGVIIESYHYDTVISVTTGRSAKQFSVINLCTVKITYDGPIYDIQLFEPGVNVITGTPISSDTTNVNPKELTQVLTSTGTWTIVVNHGILSSTILTPFEAVVYTDDGDLCKNLCTDIAYTTGLFPGRSDICLCEDKFTWNSGSQLCIIDCSIIANAITNTSVDQCSCNLKFQWNADSLECLKEQPAGSAWCLNRVSAQAAANLTTIEYSPDRSLFVTRTDSGTVTVWSANNNRPLGTLAITGTPSDVKFSTNGTMIAVASTNSKIRLYNSTYPFSQLTSMAFDASHGNGAVYMQFNNESSHLVTCGGNNNKVKIWDFFSTNTPQSQYNINNVYDCGISPNMELATTRSNNRVQLYPADGIASTIWSDIKQNCYSLDMGPAGSKMSVVCNDGGNYRGLIYDLATGTDTQPITASATLRTTNYAKSGLVVAYGGDDQIVYLVDPSNNSVVAQYTVEGAVLSLDFSDDGRYLIVGTATGSIYEFSKNCLDCPAGSYANSSTVSCQFCSQHNRACGNCINGTYCIECVQGYYLQAITTHPQTTRQCLSCNILLGCAGCNSSTVCFQCLVGYYLNSTNNQCYTCDISIPGCIRCTTNTTCEQCHHDFYLNAGTCTTCSALSHCLLCNTSSICLKCQIGFYANAAGVCTPCSTSCLACNSASDCLECSAGYLVDSSGGCSLCGGGCLMCNNTGFCFDCQVSKYLSGGVCSDCPYPCNQCNSTDCLNCVLGFYLQTDGSCLECQNPCQTCNSSSFCLSCGIGYYITATNTCSQCDLIEDFCEECTSTLCLNCTLGYYLNASSQCVQCSQDMFACVSCTSINDCVTCDYGYYLTASSAANDSCLACTQGCHQCNSTSYCWACLPGYYLTANQCHPCDPPCAQCISSTECLECEESYYLSGTDCEECSLSIPGCTLCDDESGVVCQSCQMGLYLDSGSCSSCTAPCLVCNSSDCFGCQLGYYISGGACSLCPQNCTSCTSPTFCSSCSIGFYFDSNLCLHCSGQGCMTCNDTHCLSCQSGYYINSTNDCYQCINSLPFCQICSDSTFCSQCSFGYTPAADGSSCVACSQIMIGCYQCSTLAICDICQTGYYHDSGSCLVCPSQCSSCSSSTNCLTCRPSFILNGVNCLPCENYIEGCQLCEDSLTCIDCRNGYYLSASSCTLCRSAMKGCQYCSSSSVCDHCSMGYYLDSSYCSLCELSIQGCQVCRDSTTCIQCQNGYYLSSNDCFVCQASIPGCILCQDSSTCLECLQGYFLDSGVCEVCTEHIEGCISCVDSSSCQQCEGAYYLNSGDNLCYACPNAGCQVCNETNPSKCITCNTMYFLSGSNQCLFCKNYMEGCTECTSSSNCNYCESGYFLNSTNRCQLCQESIEGCSKCNDSTNCYQCKSSYYLSGTSCITCLSGIQGCSYCQNNSQCIGCSFGFYLNDTTKQCQLCTTIDGCLACSDPVTCLVCEGDYFLQSADNLCYPCSVMEGCYSCIDNTTCKVCIGGYILIDDDKICEFMTVEADEEIQGMKMYTEYKSEKQLTHTLLANQMTYSKQTYSLQEWNNSTTITLKYPSFSLEQLPIEKVMWMGSHELVFVTGNPLKEIDLNSIPARLLASMPEGYMTYIEIKQDTITVILPDLYMSSNLVMNYDLSNPEFSQSIAEDKLNLAHAAFGIFIIVILTINYIVRGVLTCPNEAVSQYGQILPHVMALKSAPFIIYPLYAEEIAYAYGFMMAQFPWASDKLADELADKSEYIPIQYSVFYRSMSFGTTYILGFVVGCFCLAVMWLYYKNSDDEEGEKEKKEKKRRFQSEYSKKKKDEQKFEWGLPSWPFKIVAYNFFIFGLVFNSSASLQSAFLNPIQRITVNAIFTVVGIMCYVLAFVDSIYCLKQYPLYFFKLRVLAKATILSSCYISPMYMFSFAFVTDLLLMVIEYRLTKQHKTCPKLWLWNNFIVNVTLLFLVFVHSHYVTLIFASLFILSIVIGEGYVHYQDYRGQANKSKFISGKKEYMVGTGQLSTFEKTVPGQEGNLKNIWKINFFEEGKDKEQKGKLKQQNKLSNKKTEYRESESKEGRHSGIKKQKEARLKEKPNTKMRIQQNYEQSAAKLDSMNEPNNDEEEPAIFIAGDFMYN